MEQARVRRVPKGPIKRYGENLGGSQHGHADSQTRQFSQMAKDVVHPVAGEPWNSLAIKKESKHGAVALLLSDE